MIRFDEAIARIRATARSLGTERVSLSDAVGRVLASKVVANIDSPRRDSSAMDGYAVRDDDLANLPARLRIVGESFAGAGWNGSVSPGTCARIFTGAPVPAGADRVVMQENVRREGDYAILDANPGHGRHIRNLGSDFRTGDELLSAGRLLGPRAIVAAAACDVATLEVYRRPRLRILSTGDELAEPGTARNAEYAIPDSVSFGVAALAQQWGARCDSQKRLRDDLASLEAAASNSQPDADVIVVTGGASVGEKDFAKDMFAPLGMELVFSKVSIKPGKPVWLGRVGRLLVLGLPGNPTSALVTARLFLAPLLARLGGRDIEVAFDWKSVSLGSALDRVGDRETFHRAVMRNGAAEILSFQDSSAQKALADADILVRQRAGSRALAPGDQVEILDF